MNLKLSHTGSTSRSLDQILEQPCVRCRGHIFSPIPVKLCQNVGLDEILDVFEIGSCGVKNQVTRSNLRKTLCKLLRPHFPILMKFGRNVCLDEFSDEFENGSCGV